MRAEWTAPSAAGEEQVGEMHTRSTYPNVNRGRARGRESHADTCPAEGLSVRCLPGQMICIPSNDGVFGFSYAFVQLNIDYDFITFDLFVK